MSYTHYEDWTSGDTIYAKANPLNTTTWSTGVISGSENGTTGNYAFASVSETVRYTIYKQAGASPASTDEDIGFISYLATDLIAAAVASSALFTGITSLANWLRALARSDTADATAKSEINSGGGTYNEADDSLQANEAVAVIPAILASSIAAANENVRYRGTKWTFTFNDIGSQPAKALFTIKDRDTEDENAILQADDATGLLRINGSTVGVTPAWATIVYSLYDSGTKRRATVTILANATKSIGPKDRLVMDLKATDGPDIIGSGILKVLADTTRAIS